MRVLKFGAAVAALVMISAGTAAAQFSYQIDTMSRYIWRGFDLFKAGALTIAPLVNYTFVFLKEVNLHNEFWFGLSFIY
jgi:hypothetical protein